MLLSNTFYPDMVKARKLCEKLTVDNNIDLQFFEHTIFNIIFKDTMKELPEAWNFIPNGKDIKNNYKVNLGINFRYRKLQILNFFSNCFCSFIAAISNLY